jgi:arabinose-5-phosphate isomerase
MAESIETLETEMCCATEGRTFPHAESGVKELFEKEKKILDHFFSQIDTEPVDQLLSLLKACKGMIFITGVGKSGLVAEKIALTLTSTGTRAFFLSPSNALHGDIGIVRTGDLFLMISKSGESEELLQLIPALRNKNVTIGAILNMKNSRLSKAADLAVHLPLQQELCHYDIVPTSSTVTQMIFGNILAVAMMIHLQFSLEDYAQNHPAGKIGRRLTLRVEDLMLQGHDVPLCGPQEKLVDLLVTLSGKRCGCILVVDPQKALLGIFTDGDLRRALQRLGSKALDSNISELMTLTPRTILPSEMAIDAIRKMEADQQHPITVLPVVDQNNQVQGLIKMHDILQSGL